MVERLALVTGACGFTGSHMVNFLISRENFHIRATDLKTTDHSYLDKLGVEFVASDFRDKKSLERVIADVDCIFNIASLFDYNASWQTVYEVNVKGFQNLCEVAIDSDIKKIIHISTASIYKKRTIANFPITENYVIKPSTTYDQSKWEQEKIGWKFLEENGLPISFLRPAPLYGPRNRYGVFSVISIIAKSPITINPKIFPKNKNPKFQMVHAVDVVGAAYYLSKKNIVGEVFNLVDDATNTLDEFISYVSDYLQRIKISVQLWHPIFLTFIKISELVTSPIAILTRFFKLRTILEPHQIKYMKYSYWYSNEKIKKVGYEFKYPNWKEGGMKETLEWYIAKDWIKSKLFD